MRKRTGIRNRYRPNGRSPYSREGKSRTADHYGTWTLGRQDRPDTIAGHMLAYRTRAHYESWE